MRTQAIVAPLTWCLLAMMLQSHLAAAADSSSLWRLIPGGNVLRDLTHRTMAGIGNLYDETWAKAFAIADQTGVTECLSCKQDPDAKRNVSEIIRSRGFHAEEYDVVTKDGYVLTIQRIVNPLVRADYKPKMKPVIMQHGLMSSSADWVINSCNVRPSPVPGKSAREKRARSTSRRLVTRSDAEDTEDNPNGLSYDQNFKSSACSDTQEHPNSLGFYLANQGYDVFLSNSRGNTYGQKHINMSSWDPKFWAFTFDEQIKYDLPDVIEFVQRLTGHTKVGYVGHSQGTVMGFGLMSDRPEYADIIEPFIALAPVAYVNHCLSPAKYFAVYTPVFQHINMWFATSNTAVKYLGPIVCSPKVVRREICENLLFLGVGFDEEQFDADRVSAYLAHEPSGTSVKNIAHYGQEVLSGRFQHFDHGILGNQIKYGTKRAPDYDLSKIRSKSIALFIAENDWLASPIDVARLRASLTVQPFAVVNMTELNPKWNHIDFVYGKSAGELVNTRIFQIFEHFK